MTTRTLAENLYKSARAVHRTKKSRRPILNATLISHYNGRLVLVTHDAAEPLAAFAPCRWEGDQWAACVPMRPLKDWLAIVAKSKEVLDLSFDADALELTFTTDARITGTRSRTIFKCLPACEFPPVDFDEAARKDREARWAL